MIGIITGDIVNSRKLSSELWMNGFKALLNTFGKTPADWEIYRGDEFQLEVKQPEAALFVALQLKAYFKTLKLDVRMSIGIGDKTYSANKISESNGSAFLRSGEVFQSLKKQKINLAINTGNQEVDTDLNLKLRLASTFMDAWLPQSAELVLTALQNPNLSQEGIGQKLGINQAAVSRRRKRAQFDLLLETETDFRQKIKNRSI
ncbi:MULTISPECIES: SatD family protein [Flavobacterium]|uniref:SatD family protein n=1 Tax=Flavobacterium sedimenticola TaxID=3043286 RepID=A0ABT6XPN6_9FLAO|nr:SatD family protein [Flavobacterium sedimenticola]MDI9256983.1 SatD family protein [Flavobacterium sedimenticola]